MTRVRGFLRRRPPVRDSGSSEERTGVHELVLMILKTLGDRYRVRVSTREPEALARRSAGPLGKRRKPGRIVSNWG